MLDEGQGVPDVRVTLPDDSEAALADIARGRAMVVYFYPRDDTSGCTREAQDFSAMQGEFEAVEVMVLGVSKDTPARHRKFAEKYDLAVPLATDGDGSVCEAFGVWVEKSLYGKRYMGIERATFLFDESGTLVRAWRKVKVPGHAAAVLEAVRALSA